MAVCLLILLVTGCSSPNTQSAERVGTETAIANQPGLFIEQWTIETSDGRLDAAISSVLSEDEQQLHGGSGFRRDGFRAVVLTSQDLETLRRSLKNTIPARRVQHGEALAWRDVLSRYVERRTVVLENGRMRRLPRGIVSLAARGWSIPMIDGAGLHVQLVPHVVEQGARPQTTLRPGDLRGFALADTLEVTLEATNVLLVTSEPSLNKPEPEKSTDTAPPLDDSQPIGPPAGPIGPAAPLPPTVAELLLDEDNGRLRSVLILHGTPHPSLLPPESE